MLREETEKPLVWNTVIIWQFNKSNVACFLSFRLTVQLQNAEKMTGYLIADAFFPTEHMLTDFSTSKKGKWDRLSSESSKVLSLNLYQSTIKTMLITISNYSWEMSKVYHTVIFKRTKPEVQKSCTFLAVEHPQQDLTSFLHGTATGRSSGAWPHPKTPRQKPWDSPAWYAAVLQEGRRLLKCCSISASSIRMICISKHIWNNTKCLCLELSCSRDIPASLDKEVTAYNAVFLCDKSCVYEDMAPKCWSLSNSCIIFRFQLLTVEDSTFTSVNTKHCFSLLPL